MSIRSQIVASDYLVPIDFEPRILLLNTVNLEDKVNQEWICKKQGGTLGWGIPTSVGI